jgi:hypothetical protein
MKKSLLAALALAIVSVSAQDESHTWRLGIQGGPQGNHSVFTGGMTEANARFHHNAFGSGALTLMARYDFDRHWMITGGIGLSSFGFEYSIAENYSLLAKNPQNTTIRSEFSVFDMPTLIYYKFNPNCKNVRWLIGGGFAQQLTGAMSLNRSVSQANDGNTSVNYISSTSSTNGGLLLNFRWTVAREKMFRNGSILNASVIFNLGFNKIATSTVNYTIDNQNYTHTFSNNGNFVGLRISYFLKPFDNPWAKKKNQLTR